MRQTVNVPLEDLEKLAGVISIDRDTSRFVRASSSCGLQAFRYATESDISLEDDKYDANANRMWAGNSLEDRVWQATRDKFGAVTYRQLFVIGKHSEYPLYMTGHIDGMVPYGPDKWQILEIKTTSSENFNSVLKAIDNWEDNDVLDAYVRQMRRYAGMLFYSLSDMVLNFGKLAIMNRDTCEIAWRDLTLFEEDEDFDFDAEVISMFGGANPLTDTMPDRPDDKYRSHIICQSCVFRGDCYPTNSDDAVDNAYAEDAVEYTDADTAYKSAEKVKSRIKKKMVEKMDKRGVNKITMSDRVSVTRYEQSSKHGKVNYDAMIADGVYDRYVSEPNPFPVVRFNIKR